MSRKLSEILEEKLNKGVELVLGWNGANSQNSVCKILEISRHDLSLALKRRIESDYEMRINDGPDVNPILAEDFTPKKYGKKYPFQEHHITTLEDYYYIDIDVYKAMIGVFNKLNCKP